LSGNRLQANESRLRASRARARQGKTQLAARPANTGLKDRKKSPNRTVDLGAQSSPQILRLQPFDFMCNSISVSGDKEKDVEVSDIIPRVTLNMRQ
jgi:hypothetical protein